VRVPGGSPSHAGVERTSGSSPGPG
jgi:hypothetical protein